MSPAQVTPFSRCRCEDDGCGDCTPCPNPFNPVIPDNLVFDRIMMRWAADGNCYEVYLGGNDLGVGPILTTADTGQTCPA